MNFLKKIFKSDTSTKGLKESTKNSPFESIEDSFVHNFIAKGGRFIYCTAFEEITNNLHKIVKSHNFKELLCYDNDLLKLTKSLNTKTLTSFTNKTPFFTTCEHLISNEGDILFSSNQLGSNRLSEYYDFFIVYATTSQLVKNTSEGLSGIKINYKDNLPTNISSVKNYITKDINENFMNYGNTNSKKTYLILFEDL